MTTETSDTIVVQDYYIKKLEENVTNLTKTKIILETNIDVFTKMIEQRDQKFQEINAKNYELNETIGNLTTRHQEEIELLKKGFEAKFGELHFEAMQEVEKTHREKNEMAAELHNRINAKQLDIDHMTYRMQDLNDELLATKKEILPYQMEVIKTDVKATPKTKDKYKLGKSNNTGM